MKYNVVEPEPLKEIYDGKLSVGVALNTKTFKTPYADYIKKNFNSVTCENEMKPDYVINKSLSQAGVKEDSAYVAINFNAAKDIIEFCKSNDIKMRYHTLVWQNQTPDWFFYEDYDVSKNLVDAEIMKARMKNYIYSVIEYFDSEYPELLYTIDVVNEAFNGGGEYSIKRTDNLWNTTIGYNYVYYAFLYAREAIDKSENMKNVTLVYNDYAMLYKLDKVGKGLENLFNANGADVHKYVDAIGFQGHIDTNIDMTEYLKVMKGILDMGYEVQITELDIAIPKVKSEDSPTQEQLTKQAETYKKLMLGISSLKEEGYNITSVSVWGINDANSWIMKHDGYNSYALLWNSDMTAKPALRGFSMCDNVNLKEKDSTFTNPVIYSDIPDPDVISVLQLTI